MPGCLLGLVVVGSVFVVVADVVVVGVQIHLWLFFLLGFIVVGVVGMLR